MSSILKAKGLHTFQNELSEIPPGALLEATNVVIDREGIIEQRRGFGEYASFTHAGDRAKQLLLYKNTILRHYLDTASVTNKLEYDNGSGSFSAFNGTYNEVESGLRIRSVEANGNLYFTTNTGIKKISATSSSQFTTAANYITDAGGLRALDVTAVINYATAGFFTANRTVAYRIVWGLKDANGNVILGFPSSRTVIANTDASLTGTVDLTFTIPGEVTNTNYFYQVYRTSVSTSSSSDDPGDEMYLVYENTVTSTQISAKTVTVNDLVPEDIRSGGALLYINPVSGVGIEQANEKPPLAKDVALFKGSVFYANTTTKHRKTFNLLSVTAFTSGTSKFIVSTGTTTNTYTFVGTKEISTVTCLAPGAITNATYFLINSASDARKYFVWLDKTGATTQPSNSETSGRIPIKADISGAANSTDVAIAIKTALNTKSDFTATNIANVVTVTNNNNGNTTNTADSSTAPTGFAFATTQAGTGEDAATNKVLLSALPTPSQQIDETARSLVNIINKNSSETVNAFYLSGPSDVPGMILLESKTLVDVTFYIGVNQSAISTKFSPTLPVTTAITAISMANPTIITSAAHGLSTGDVAVLYGSDSTPSVNGEYVITKIDANNFSVAVNVLVAGTTGTVLSGSQGSDNEISPNRIYFSKYQQPEAVPLTNFLDVGPKDKPIRRILALRDSLLVLKDDAIYRLTGQEAPNFTDTIIDSSTIITAYDTAAILNNQVYCLSQQGIVQISDTGVGIVSRSIEDLILKVTIPSFTNFSSISWATAYETDRAYLIWLPTLSSDTYATQCYRYNTFTQCWTRLDIAATCGLVNNNKLYLGSGVRNTIDQERKNFNRTDYADRMIALSLGNNAVSDTTITLSNTSSVTIGDVLSQTQYLPISLFNRLLKKLDIDISVNNADYYSTLAATSGVDLRLKINALASKLDADPGVTDSNYLASLVGTDTFPVIQSDFNIIVNKLNLDTGVYFSNYPLSSGTYVVESVITAKSKTAPEVTILHPVPFIKGNIDLYKGITTQIVWAPNAFGDPSVMKQVREGTLLFEHNVFTSAEIAYSSDLSPNYEEIPFAFNGPGVWGMFVWGANNWGGDENSTPLRTLVPQQKQRCRYLNCRFKHANAREKYSILGLSMVPRSVSERGYK